MTNLNKINIEKQNKLFKELDYHIEQINNLYSEYKFWNGDFLNEYKNENGEKFNEIILNYLFTNLNIK